MKSSDGENHQNGFGFSLPFCWLAQVNNSHLGGRELIPLEMVRLTTLSAFHIPKTQHHPRSKKRCTWWAENSRRGMGKGKEAKKKNVEMKNGGNLLEIGGLSPPGGGGGGFHCWYWSELVGKKVLKFSSTCTNSLPRLQQLYNPERNLNWISVDTAADWVEAVVGYIKYRSQNVTNYKVGRGEILLLFNHKSGKYFSANPYQGN